jgi:hypothetical protein
MFEEVMEVKSRSRPSSGSREPGGAEPLQLHSQDGMQPERRKAGRSEERRSGAKTEQAACAVEGAVQMRGRGCPVEHACVAREIMGAEDGVHGGTSAGVLQRADAHAQD